MTYWYEPGFTWNHWAADYGAMYIFGPILGALMGGNLYNYIRRLEYRLPKMKTNVEAKKQKKKSNYFDDEDKSSGTSVRTSELSDSDSGSRDSRLAKAQLKSGIGKMMAIEYIDDEDVERIKETHWP